MSLTVNDKYQFDGPFSDIEDIKNQSGVYIITSKNNSGKHGVHDIGESGELKDRLLNHDRTDCWKRKANGRTIYYSAYYCDEPKRKAVEQELRNSFSNLCGDI